ncbi:mannosyltransferase [Savitreella phatthalungensis]
MLRVKRAAIAAAIITLSLLIIFHRSDHVRIISDQFSTLRGTTSSSTSDYQNESPMQSKAPTTGSCSADGGLPDISHQDQITFWANLSSALLDNPPGVGELQRDGAAELIGYDTLDFSNTTRVPLPHINMTEEQVATMKAAHDKYVDRIAGQESNVDLVYANGTRGIVVTAGGKYLPLVAMTLRLLRRFGSKLPMEVFLENPSEYESHFCQQVLPSFNARCVILAEYIDPVKTKTKVHLYNYQLKVFALLFSSFEEVLFLDADAWPVKDPEQLFESEPFKSTGYVLWPDFWAISPSQHFYDIIGSTMPSMYRQASSETGEILISKRMHGKSLLLSAYWNYYGPLHYYRLQSQHAPGEGDKETFVAAAERLGEPFYQVSEPVSPIGHAVKGKWEGTAMVQFDPRDDYTLTQQGIYRVQHPAKERDAAGPRPRPFFMHINFPKFNPALIYDDPKVTLHENGTHRRAFDLDPSLGFGDYDIERRFWEEAEWVACKLENRIRTWYGQSGICDKAKKYYADVFGSTRLPDYLP